MKTKFLRTLLLLICLAISALLLSGCQKAYFVYIFNVRGFLDTNANGELDSGEIYLDVFRVSITLTTNNGAVPRQNTLGKDIRTVQGETFFFPVTNDFGDFDAEYSFRVTQIPDGFEVGNIDTVLTSTTEEPDEEGTIWILKRYDVLIAFIPIETPATATPTPTSTPTSTATPTSAPLPTSTYTPTPTITAEITSYGSYGGGVDFVKFKITNKPSTGTFSAMVNGVSYTCPPVPAGENTIECQGPAFPSGRYVDVVLYYEGMKIFSGQILRVTTEPDKKPTEEIPQ